MSNSHWTHLIQSYKELYIIINICLLFAEVLSPYSKGVDILGAEIEFPVWEFNIVNFQFPSLRMMALAVNLTTIDIPK